MSPHAKDFPYGTLDLLILKSLETMGAMHGYGLARRIEQMAGSATRLSQGSVYPALVRLEQHGWIRGTWAVSDSGRRVRSYSLTPAGSRHLEREVANWARAASLMTRMLETGP